MCPMWSHEKGEQGVDDGRSKKKNNAIGAEKGGDWNLDSAEQQ